MATVGDTPITIATGRNAQEHGCYLHNADAAAVKFDWKAVPVFADDSGFVLNAGEGMSLSGEEVAGLRAISDTGLTNIITVAIPGGA